MDARTLSVSALRVFVELKVSGPLSMSALAQRLSADRPAGEIPIHTYLRGPNAPVEVVSGGYRTNTYGLTKDGAAIVRHYFAEMTPVLAAAKRKRVAPAKMPTLFNNAWLLLASVHSLRTPVTKSQAAAAVGITQDQTINRATSMLLDAGLIRRAKDPVMIRGRARDAFVSTTQGGRALSAFAHELQSLRKRARVNVFMDPPPAPEEASPPAQTASGAGPTTSHDGELWSLVNLQFLARKMAPRNPAFVVPVGPLRRHQWESVRLFKNVGDLATKSRPNGRDNYHDVLFVPPDRMRNMAETVLELQKIASTALQDAALPLSVKQVRSFSEAPTVVRTLHLAARDKGFEKAQVHYRYGVSVGAVSRLTKALLEIKAIEPLSGSDRAFGITDFGRDLLVDRCASSLPLLVELGRAFTTSLPKADAALVADLTRVTDASVRICKERQLVMPEQVISVGKALLQPEGLLANGSFGHRTSLT